MAMVTLAPPAGLKGTGPLGCDQERASWYLPSLAANCVRLGPVPAPSEAGMVYRARLLLALADQILPSPRKSPRQRLEKISHF